MSTKRISTLAEHRALLKEVLQTAKGQVLIVSPFISGSALKADGIVKLVRKAVTRGVRVSVYIDDQLNRQDGDLKKSAGEGIVELVKAGAGVTVLAGIHNKTLIRDNDLITEGSFNWLSAVRTAGGTHQREERTLVVDGIEAQKMIEEEIKSISKATSTGAYAPKKASEPYFDVSDIGSPSRIACKVLGYVGAGLFLLLFIINCPQVLGLVFIGGLFWGAWGIGQAFAPKTRISKAELAELASTTAAVHKILNGDNPTEDEDFTSCPFGPSNLDPVKSVAWK